MTESVISIVRVSYHPSGRQEETVGYVHYAFDAPAAIARLKSLHGDAGAYITKVIPCLSIMPSNL